MLIIEDIIASSENTVLFNVFQFPLLSHEECVNLSNVILDHRYSHPHEGSMQKYTVDTVALLPDFINKLMTTMKPIVNSLFDFGKEVSYSLYTAHAIIYSAEGEGEKKLGLHVDDSDITINITLLTENLLGNELRFLDSTPFGNDFCNKHFGLAQQKLSERCEILPVIPTLGGCILHRGSAPHETSTIYTGKRIALVLWLKREGSR